MRSASVTGEAALAERIGTPEQVPPNAEEAVLPPYLESLLAHLRLLVGIPFDYLVPDAGLLPDESIRFFYLDRSWTDRVVDGVLAVGKAGTREQAHHQAHTEGVRRKLDQVERVVRPRQRRLGPQDTAVDTAKQKPAETATGFLLRSALVSGWPHMEVRAFDAELPEQVSRATAEPHELKTLRLERLSPSMLIAIFEGVPKLVWLEEPHNGIQMGVREDPGGFVVLPRGDDGVLISSPPNAPPPIPVPVRAAHPRVIGVEELSSRIGNAVGALAPADVSDHLAVQLLRPPWRQRFQGGLPDPAARPQVGAAGFEPTFMVAGASASITLTAMRRLIEADR